MKYFPEAMQIWPCFWKNVIIDINSFNWPVFTFLEVFILMTMKKSDLNIVFPAVYDAKLKSNSVYTVRIWKVKAQTHYVNYG